ncbi:hypothetical protein BH18ACI2_BH18ACI2_04610 [soil metagenome]
MAKSDFHCNICKNVGGRNGKGMYKCHKHKTICERCVTTRGFFSVTYLCKECEKELLEYEFNDKKGKWEQV